MNFKPKQFLTALCCLPLLASLAGASDYFVVTDLGARAPSLSVSDVREIFLGQKLFLGNSRRIYPVLSRLSDASVDTFMEEVLGMQNDQYDAYWRGKLFAGKGHPPKEFQSDQEALAHAQQNAGSVAVVSRMPRRVEAKGLRVFRVEPAENQLIAVNPGP